MVKTRDHRKVDRLAKFKLAVGLATMFSLTSTGMALALLTDSEMKQNDFTMVSLTGFDQDGWLRESNWDALKARNLLPGDTVAKNPSIENRTPISAWMFMKVTVPGYEVEGQEFPVEAFTLNELNTRDFTLLEKTCQGGTTTYVYSLKNQAVPRGSSGTLFKSVTLVDMEEKMAELGNDSWSHSDAMTSASIMVTGYAVQSSSTLTNASEAWAVVAS